MSNSCPDILSCTSIMLHQLSNSEAMSFLAAFQICAVRIFDFAAVAGCSVSNFLIEQENAFVGPFLQVHALNTSGQPGVHTVRWSSVAKCLQLHADATGKTSKHSCIRLKVV